MALMTATARGSDSAGPSRARRAVFLDKDGTLVENVPYNVDPALLRLTPYAAQGLRMMAEHGYRLIVVTNQSGIARGYFDRAALDRVHAALGAMLRAEGVHIDDYFVCPHAPAASPSSPDCACRKPQPGLLFQAAREHGIDLHQSWMIGDILNDVEAGHRAGCRAILMDVGNETEWQMTPQRQPELRVAHLLEAARAITASRMSSTATDEEGVPAPSLLLDTLSTEKP